MTQELKASLNTVLPLHDNEIRFIASLRDNNTIDASAITDDSALQQIVESHPALLWALSKSKTKKSTT